MGYRDTFLGLYGDVNNSVIKAKIKSTVKTIIDLSKYPESRVRVKWVTAF